MSLAWFTMSPLISGHQNLRWMNDKVMLVPGWPEKREEWPPLDHPHPPICQDELDSIQAAAWCCLGPQCFPYQLADIHLDRIGEDLWLENGLQRLRGVGALEVAREGVRLHFFRASSVGQMEIDTLIIRASLSQGCSSRLDPFPLSTFPQTPPREDAQPLCFPVLSF